MKNTLLVLLGIAIGAGSTILVGVHQEKAALQNCNQYCTDNAPNEIAGFLCKAQCSQIIEGSFCLRFPPIEVEQSE